MEEEFQAVSSSHKKNTKPGLLRHLGLWAGVELGIAAMIGGSIYTLTGFGAGLAGPSLVFAMLFTALFAALPTVLVYAELGSTKPETGGGYLWVRENLGSVQGHFFGWFSWCAHAVACGVYALSFGFYFATLLDLLLHGFIGPPGLGNERLWQLLFSVATIVILSIVNYRGVKHTEMFGRVVVLVTIGSVLLFVVLGFFSFFRSGASLGGVKLLTYMPFGGGGLLAAMGLIFLGFQGFEVVVQTAEEMKDPRRNIPKALLFSFIILLVLYLGVTAASFLGVHGDQESWKILAEAGQGALIAAASYFPFSIWLVPIVILGGAVVGLAALSATIYSASHVFYAMTQKGRSLPVELQAVHPKYGTPFVGIFASAAFTIVLTVVFPIRDIAATVDLLFFFLFIQIHLAYIQARRKYPTLLRPFRAPLYPWLSIVAIVTLCVLATQVVRITPWSLSFFLGWLVLGMIIHRVYVERHESGEFARGKVMESSESRGQESSRLLLFPVIFQTTWWKDVLPFVSALTNQTNNEIFVLNLAENPSRDSENQISKQLKDEIRKFHEELEKRVSELGVTYTVRSQLTENITETILLAVQKLDADLLVLPYEYVPRRRTPRIARSAGNLSPDFQRLLRESRCDLVMFKPTEYHKPGRLLVGVKESSHNKLVGAIAKAFATEFSAKIALLNVSEYSQRDRVDWKYFLEELNIPDSSRIEKHYLIAEEAVDTILLASAGYDVIILGAGESSMFDVIDLGTTAQRIADRSDKIVFVCYQHEQTPVFFTRFLDTFIERVSSIGRAGAPRAEVAGRVGATDKN